MKLKLTNKFIFSSLLAAILIISTQCTTVPEWQKKSQELIKQYNLTVREIPGLPKTGIKSNLEPGKVMSLDNFSSTE